MRPVSYFAALFVLVSAARAAADDKAAPRPAPMPEPILTESITDLDAVEGGETEFALNGQTLHAARGGARAWQASVEAEWRATSHLGVRLEPSYANLEEEGRSREFGLQVAAAWGLFHDFQNDLHVQVEATGRLSRNEKPFESQPGDSALPYSAGLRVGSVSVLGRFAPGRARRSAPSQRTCRYGSVQRCFTSSGTRDGMGSSAWNSMPMQAARRPSSSLPTSWWT